MHARLSPEAWGLPLPPDPKVLSWRFTAQAVLDLSRPPEGVELSDSAWAEVLAHRGVWVDGRPDRLGASPGEIVAIYAFSAPPPPLAFDPAWVLLDREGVVAINKPSGLSTQRTRASAPRCLEEMLRIHFNDQGLRAVHRIDRDTSGIVLFARDGATTSALHSQFRRDQVEKRYLALVSPAPPAELFEVEGHIARLEPPITYPAPLRFGLWPYDGPPPSADREPKTSQTRFATIAADETHALVEARPITGRTHQIRVHLAHIGAPVLGDPLYGDASLAPRLLLHAAGLSFRLGAERQGLDCP